MDSGSQHKILAEQVIERELERCQNRAATVWHGVPKTAVMEIVRSLDVAAFYRWVTGYDDSSDGDAARRADLYAGIGAAAALRPFLAKIKGMRGGVPLSRSTANSTRFTYAYLVCCGELSHLRRMAALERYGLASTQWTAPNQMHIEVRRGLPEQAALYAIRSLRPRASQRLVSQPTLEEKKELWDRMRGYVDTDPQTFIRYDNDLEIVSSYRADARAYGQHYLEGEAFPSNVVLGDRTFGEWKNACDQALGRILTHIDFAHLLTQKRSKKVALRDILTIPAKRDDAAAVWREAALSADLVDSTMVALTLTIDGLDDWEQSHEPPASFYVDFGRDFVLLSCFGALNNPYFALFRHLRSVYRADWDRGVDRREAVFRDDLSKLFSEPRFLVPPNGFTLRRQDGSILTDIDAVVLDRDRGTLALVQLKWHDPVGRSLTERESRRRNMSQANQWVERVSSWVDGRTSNQILRALGLHENSADRPPLLYVIARYVARFTDEIPPDPRAIWLGWPEILQAKDTALTANDPLIYLNDVVTAHRARFNDLHDSHQTFHFPGLSVDLRVSS